MTVWVSRQRCFHVQVSMCARSPSILYLKPLLTASSELLELVLILLMFLGGNYRSPQQNLFLGTSRAFLARGDVPLFSPSQGDRPITTRISWAQPTPQPLRQSPCLRIGRGSLSRDPEPKSPISRSCWLLLCVSAVPRPGYTQRSSQPSRC